ncbi:hypothetical protein Cgig2_030661 [Carnegiea gigantea]|uniref:Endonuclease/exonuclease/phosphatase family protein n=1 Tax=Carnegiea gigantea TaxID=171969 RepID=A0A9Q1GN45_9CARY|nr:hypothetical protein Cgig2_030661 [Carnegiea gigantea]
MQQNVAEERGVQGGDNSMKLLIWNICGAGSNNFLNSIKEHIQMHKPQIITLLETLVNGPTADEICRKIGYQGVFREEACGHQGVANGKNTMFWSQVWVGSQPSKELALQPIPPNEHSTKVAGYWDQDRGWKWEEFSGYLPSTTLKEIASFELTQDTKNKDNVF